MSDSVLPANWAEAQFDDVITFRTGYAFKSSEFKPNGVFVLRVTNISPSGDIDLDNPIFISQKDYEAKYRDFSLNDGDVVIVMVGATTGKLGRIKQEILPAVLNQNMWKLSPKYSDEVGRKFLYYYLRHIQPEVLKGAGGSATGFIKQGDFKQRKYPLPPVGEQNRIVAKIESTQEKIKTIEESVSKAEELIGKYRESLLQKAFRGQLVPQDPNDEPASELLKRIRAERAQATDSKKKEKEDLPPISDDEIPFEIPKSWEWVSLKLILEKLTDGTHHSPPNHDKGDFKYISAKNIKDWGIDLTKITYVSKSVHKEIYSRCDPKFGDVLLIKDGATTGIATINTLDEPFSMLSSVALLRPSIGLTSDYLLWFLKSNEFQAQILGDMAGAAIKRVTLSKLANMLIPLPPLKEQGRIIAEINMSIGKLEESKKALNDIAENAKSLSQSILSSAFSGKLVPQNPSEGTGHELLKKIESEESPAAETKALKKP
ncbi:restriction endonuclease subunit S [Bdellovibrio bacteriovorus]|uniref:restriction endonuclease subunit S n=1 Tax=Bdellovibrio bacteriovorus TaxID=959 RepID=UPI0035A64373